MPILHGAGNARYIPKFINGVWVVFDAKTYKHITLCYTGAEAATASKQVKYEAGTTIPRNAKG